MSSPHLPPPQPKRNPMKGPRGRRKKKKKKKKKNLSIVQRNAIRRRQNAPGVPVLSSSKISDLLNSESLDPNPNPDVDLEFEGEGDVGERESEAVAAAVVSSSRGRKRKRTEAFGSSALLPGGESESSEERNPKRRKIETTFSTIPQNSSSSSSSAPTPAPALGSDPRPECDDWAVTQALMKLRDNQLRFVAQDEEDETVESEEPECASVDFLFGFGQSPEPLVDEEFGVGIAASASVSAADTDEGEGEVGGGGDTKLLEGEEAVEYMLRSNMITRSFYDTMTSEMGLPPVRAALGLYATQNESVDDAVSWLEENPEDATIEIMPEDADSFDGDFVLGRSEKGLVGTDSEEGHADDEIAPPPVRRQSRVSFDMKKTKVHSYEYNDFHFRDYDRESKEKCPVCHKTREQTANEMADKLMLLATDDLDMDDSTLLEFASQDMVFCDSCATWMHIACIDLKSVPESVPYLLPITTDFAVRGGATDEIDVALEAMAQGSSGESNLWVCRRCRFGTFGKRGRRRVGMIRRRFCLEIIDELKVLDDRELFWPELDVVRKKVVDGGFRTYGVFQDALRGVFEGVEDVVPTPDDSDELPDPMTVRPLVADALGCFLMRLMDTVKCSRRCRMERSQI